jgi:hypothetical protein
MKKKNKVGLLINTIEPVVYINGMVLAQKLTCRPMEEVEHQQINPHNHSQLIFLTKKSKTYATQKISSSAKGAIKIGYLDVEE